MKKIILILFCLVSMQQANAQLILRFAEYKYRILNYPDAIPYFEFYTTKRDSNDVKILRKLADCYRLTNQYTKAEKIYSILIQKDTLLLDRLYYEDAKLRVQKTSLKFDTLNIKVKSLALNSDVSDFATTMYKGKLIYTSSTQIKPFIQRNHTWTRTNFLSLLEANSDDDFQSFKAFAPELRNKFNFGPATFLERDTLMYYTTNNPKAKSKKNGYLNLRIESAEYVYGKWRKIEKFKFNSVDYACAHPSIAIDGSRLFFSSNMPGGYGGMDLYVCDWLNDSAWSAPKNLGPLINTKEEEVFPFIDQQQTLYFASNGRDGFGGLDIYYTDLSSTMSAVKTFPYPINTSDDDFAMFTYPNANAGFFSSDRAKRGIDDDIYAFEMLGKHINIYVIDSITRQVILNTELKIQNINNSTSISTIILPTSLRIVNNDNFIFSSNAEGYIPKVITNNFTLSDTAFYIELMRSKNGCNVEGVVTKKGTNVKIEEALVKIYNYNKNDLIFEGFTNSEGFYKKYNLETNTKYKISFSKNGYFSKEIIFRTENSYCEQNANSDYDYLKNIELDSIVIGKAIKIDNIYFDLAKWNIRADAAFELDKIVKLLKDNPDIIIELSSHTDARASAKYNETLSDKRAKSSAAYIISKGIEENRITGKGYGESQLINKCADGVKCTEAEHQQNRRTEFKVLGFL